MRPWLPALWMRRGATVASSMVAAALADRDRVDPRLDQFEGVGPVVEGEERDFPGHAC